MKSILLSIILLVGLTATAQPYANETKLIEYLGLNRYNSLVSSSSSYLKFLDARYSYGFEIIEYVQEKMNSFPVLTTVDLTNSDKTKTTVSIETFLDQINTNTINYLMYDLQWDRSKTTYYVLGNTGKVLMIHSVEYINEKVNQ